MKNSQYQLSFGVEIDFILVHHGKLLVAELLDAEGLPRKDDGRFKEGLAHDREISRRIDRFPTDAERMELTTVPHEYRVTRDKYLSWAIRVPSDSNIYYPGAQRTSRGNLRGYGDEHLLIAQEILRSKAQNDAEAYWDDSFASDTSVLPCTNAREGPPDYHGWRVARQDSIEALTQRELTAYLDRSKRCFARDGPESGQRGKRSLSPSEDGEGVGRRGGKRLKTAPDRQPGSLHGHDIPSSPPILPGGEITMSIAERPGSSSPPNDSDAENVPPSGLDLPALDPTLLETPPLCGRSDPLRGESPPYSPSTQQGDEYMMSTAEQPGSSSAPNDSDAENVPPSAQHVPFLASTVPDSVSGSSTSAPISLPGPAPPSVRPSAQPDSFQGHNPASSPPPKQDSGSTPSPAKQPSPPTAVNGSDARDTSVAPRLPPSRPPFKSRELSPESREDAELDALCLYVECVATYKKAEAASAARAAATAIAASSAEETSRRPGIQPQSGQPPLPSTKGQDREKSTSESQGHASPAVVVVVPDSAGRRSSQQPQPSVIHGEGQHGDGTGKNVSTSGLANNTRLTHPTIREDGRAMPTTIAETQILPPDTVRTSGIVQIAATVGPSQANPAAPTIDFTHLVSSPDLPQIHNGFASPIIIPSTPSPMKTPSSVHELAAPAGKEPTPYITEKRRQSREPVGRSPDSDEWDSHGLDLVSQILSLEDDSFDQITDLCNRLKGKKCHLHGAHSAPKDGLHVHLKVAGDDELDLPTLRHLLYILVMYEDQIDTLHLPRRRPHSQSDTAKNDLLTNRAGFETRGSQKIHNTVLTRDPVTGKIRTTVMEQTLRPLDEVRRTIWDTPAHRSLNNFLALAGGDAARLVNFDTFAGIYAEDDDGHQIRDCPPTVEFRQHESVLDGAMIKNWVLFCAGLLRLAHSLAHPPSRVDREGGLNGGYAWLEWDDGMSVWDLFRMMRLEPEVTLYFRRRAAFFAAMERAGDGASAVAEL